jgi:hypothetical protein
MGFHWSNLEPERNRRVHWSSLVRQLLCSYETADLTTNGPESTRMNWKSNAETSLTGLSQIPFSEFVHWCLFVVEK